MRKSLVSIVALGLFAGAPVMAQTTTDDATKNQANKQQTQQQQSTDQKSTHQKSTQQSTQQQTTGTQQQSAQQQRTPSAEQMQQMLSAYQESSELDGFIARAVDADGNPVLVLVTPSDFEGQGNVKAQENDVRDRLQQSRFNGVEMLQQPTIVRAIVDENNHIIALSATRILPLGTQTSGLTGQTGSQEQSQDQTGSQSQAGSAQSGTQSQTGSQAQSGTQGQTGSQDQTAMTQGQTGESDTSGAVTGGEPRTMMSEDDSTAGQADTDMGSDASELSQTDTDTTVEMGQTDTVMEMDPETGTSGMSTGENQAQSGQMDTDAQTGQAARALSEAGAGRIVRDLQQAGIDNPAEFQGQIVRARTSDGAPVFFMISSQDMQSGANDINQDEIRKNLEQADLQDIQFIGDAKLLRGDMDGDQVFVLAGSDLMGSSAQQSGQQQ